MDNTATLPSNLDSQIQDILRRLNSLNNSTTDTLERIAQDCAALPLETITITERYTKIWDLFRKIKQQARTGDEFYAVYLLGEHLGFGLSAIVLLQQAAIRNHALALSVLLGRVYAGEFKQLESSMKWGIICQRYLERRVIPELEAAAPRSQTLKEVQANLEHYKQNYPKVPSLVGPVFLPVTIDDYVQTLVENTRHCGKIGSNDFILDWEMLEVLEEFQPQSVDYDEEQLLLLLIKNLLDKKVSNLRTDQAVKPKVVAIAEQLVAKITTDIAKYNQDISLASIPSLKETAKNNFIRKVNDHIKEAKTVLEKELGWGDYLVNLFKQLLNAAIGIANSAKNTLGNQSPYAFFSYAKAPLVPELERMEHNVHQLFT